jgi:hypothetical protein
VDTSKSTTVDATSTEIDNAAKEGRLSIRSQDLAPKVIEALAIKFGPTEVVNKIAECMEATKTMAIGGKPLETPDYKTRLDALKLLLQYQIGMPVARSEVITHNVDTVQTLEAKIQRSPALRRAVGRMLDRAKQDDGEVVDVPVKEVSDSDAKAAEEALQAAPVQPETPVEAEVRTRSMGEMLRSRGKASIEEKLTR